MIQVSIDNNFVSWRARARGLLAAHIRPEEILWTSRVQHSLFASESDLGGGANSLVPKAFFGLAEAVTCHSDPLKWGLLYSLLFRITNENKHLLDIESDPEVRKARLMEKAVNRDVHKFHAFVRFRRIEIEGVEIFTAWYEPQHFTVERASPFFMRRFGGMQFSILTPYGCVHWNKEDLVFSDPVDRSKAPISDEMEEFWLLYYRSIFNPFRLKIKTMKKELPVRHWATLPEAALIPELIRQVGSERSPSKNHTP
jgi:probable DNA metabolism protein